MHRKSGIQAKGFSVPRTEMRILRLNWRDLRIGVFLCDDFHGSLEQLLVLHFTGMRFDDCFEIETYPQTNGVVPPGRGQFVTTGGAAEIGGNAPGTASHHPILARGWPLRINNLILRIFAIPVLAPAPNIAVHVIQPPRICAKLPTGVVVFRYSPFLLPNKG